MDQQNISLMIGLFVLIGIRYLFLYVWRTKRASRLPKKAYPLCCLVVCGSAFAAGFFLASVMIDSTFSALGYAFQLDRETSALAATNGEAARRLQDAPRSATSYRFRGRTGS